MARQARRGSASSDRGAAAVEFALLLPLLVLLIFGMIDFGRAINAQITITQAAREGARALALGDTNWQTRTQNAATGLSPVVVTDPANCSSGSGPDAEVEVTYNFSFITPISFMFGSTKTLTAQGVMPCES